MCKKHQHVNNKVCFDSKRFLFEIDVSESMDLFETHCIVNDVGVFIFKKQLNYYMGKQRTSINFINCQNKQIIFK